ncbi:hypothetical protein J6590_042596 [Homalodisca vitripennis]|nr:hypothetical protein J6590_042596 [Homalodisca vitripennis]
MINCAVGNASSQPRPTRDRQRQLTDVAYQDSIEDLLRSSDADLSDRPENSGKKLYSTFLDECGTGGGGDAPDNQPAASSSTQTYGIFKLPGKQEKCAICSKISLQSGGKMKRSRTACVKYNKGLHGVCLTKHVC